VEPRGGDPEPTNDDQGGLVVTPPLQPPTIGRRIENQNASGRSRLDGLLRPDRLSAPSVGHPAAAMSAVHPLDAQDAAGPFNLPN